MNNDPQIWVIIGVGPIASHGKRWAHSSTLALSNILMPLTAPNNQEATDRLNELFGSSPRYLETDNWRLLQVAKLGKQLLKADPASGWTILAGVSALSGDEVSAIENIDRAIRLSPEPTTIISKAGTLSNLGYFSKSGEVFRRALSVDVLPWHLIGEKAIATGSIVALDDTIRKAGNMQTAVREPLRKEISLAAAILRENSVTDEHVGTWLDKAGEIMRKQRLFFIDHALLFATTEEDFSQVDLSFIVDVDAKQAAELNQVLVERCVRAGIVPPECFSFGFRSNPDLNERIAA